MLIAPIQLSQLDRLNEQQFLETLEYDFLYLQTLSREYNDKNTLIRFTNDGYRILDGMNTLANRAYPNGLTVDTYGRRDFYFHTNGTLLQPRTIRINGKEAAYRLTFPLGKGRFYIEEM